MNSRYYSMEKSGDVLNIYIYGDITDWRWDESDVSSYSLSKKLSEAGDDIKLINVHINSYGGSVSEGIAIYNQLLNHDAKVRTIVDGFACSIASVIAMAGEERIMNKSSLMFIHNPWTYAAGNADELRKEADDLEKIGRSGIEAYLSRITISEEELQIMLDEESWLLPEEAMNMGFATSIEADAESPVNQSARQRVIEAIKNSGSITEERTPPMAPEEQEPAVEKNSCINIFSKL